MLEGDLEQRPALTSAINLRQRIVQDAALEKAREGCYSLAPCNMAGLTNSESNYAKFQLFLGRLAQWNFGPS